jgi:hypothetical protein
VTNRSIEDVWSDADSQARVVGILGKLPVLEKERANVQRAALDLRQFAWIVEDRQTSTRDIKDQIESFARDAEALHRQLSNLDSWALRAIEDECVRLDPPDDWDGSQRTWNRVARPSPSLLTSHLIKVRAAALQAALMLAVRKGRRRKRGAGEVALEIARTYERLTGQLATVVTAEGKPKGPFYELVAELFSVLKIEASAETQARSAARRRKDERSRRDERRKGR